MITNAACNCSHSQISDWASSAASLPWPPTPIADSHVHDLQASSCQRVLMSSHGLLAIVNKHLPDSVQPNLQAGSASACWHGPKEACSVQPCTHALNKQASGDSRASTCRLLYGQPSCTALPAAGSSCGSAALPLHALMCKFSFHPGRLLHASATFIPPSADARRHSAAWQPAQRAAPPVHCAQTLSPPAAACAAAG